MCLVLLLCASQSLLIVSLLSATFRWRDDDVTLAGQEVMSCAEWKEKVNTIRSVVSIKGSGERLTGVRVASAIELS